ncbi:MAG: ribonuclease HII [Candidatus Diapherotrites archaeon]|nr:ribonuclease HII [Candidatus Diapherotrites archaeon]
MLIAGIDEAGRGPCVGPLVMAVACIEKKHEQELVDLGVKDSKLLTAARREELFPKILGMLSEHCVATTTAKELDALMPRKSLNEIEAMKAAEMLNSLKKKPEIVFVDCPDVLEKNFAQRMRKYLSFDTIIRSEHKADFNYPVVGAASIVAKVLRDREILELEKSFGKIGSGYPHDEATITFLKNYLQLYNDLPDIVRKNWLTTQNILDERFQKKILQW